VKQPPAWKLIYTKVILLTIQNLVFNSQPEMKQRGTTISQFFNLLHRPNFLPLTVKYWLCGKQFKFGWDANYPASHAKIKAVCKCLYCPFQQAKG
jgi:hypothetical protein